MSRAWAVVLVALAGCPTRANPLYCDENSDCANGTTCNVDTHGCEALQVDAPLGDGPVGDDGPFVARTVQEVRATTTPVDTPVALTGVVVTANDQYGDKTGDFWVQEAGGGLASGIHVYGGVTSVVEQLVVGDIVDITNARKITFTAGGDFTGRTEIEVAPGLGQSLSITKTGTGTPVHTSMDVAAIAALTPSQLEIERASWAGMYVRVTQVRADSAPVLVGTTLQFGIGPFNVVDTQAELPSGITTGTCIGEIIGIVEYFKTFNVVPTQSSNIGIGSGCP